MSLDIWTQCAGKSNIEKIGGKGFRVVEDQARSSTLKIVDTQEEHDLLEKLLEESKPSLMSDCADLHYLLFTPFRYPPLDYGSRFGLPHERGIFYGSERIPTSLAEKAFYFFYFMSASAFYFEPTSMWFTTFIFYYSTEFGIDLTKGPFQNHQDEISNPLHYNASQKLGSAMRDEGIEAFIYLSARDPTGGKNIGIFSPLTFTDKSVNDPEKLQWNSTIDKEKIVFKRDKDTYLYRRSDFIINGRFPETLA